MGNTRSASPLASADTSTQQLYATMLKELRRIGPFEEELKKTCVHLVRSSAFLGVHPRKGYLLVTIKAAGPNSSDRIRKSEQLSKNRWYLEMKLAAPQEIDREFLGWARQAYHLCA